jgi:hypothetical protein
VWSGRPGPSAVLRGGDSYGRAAARLERRDPGRCRGPGRPGWSSSARRPGRPGGSCGACRARGTTGGWGGTVMSASRKLSLGTPARHRVVTGVDDRDPQRGSRAHRAPGHPPRRGPPEAGSAVPRPGTPPRQPSMRRGRCCVPAGGRPAHVPAAAPAGSATAARCAPVRPPGRSSAPRLASRSSEAGVARHLPPSPCPARPVLLGTCLWITRHRSRHDR